MILNLFSTWIEHSHFQIVLGVHGAFSSIWNFGRVFWVFLGFWVRLEFLWKLALLKFWFCFRSNRNFCWNRVSWWDLFARELWGALASLNLGLRFFKWVIRFWFWVSDMIGDVWVTWVVLWNNRTFIGKLARTLKFLAVHIWVTLSFFGLTSFWILGWSLLDSIV